MGEESLDARVEAWAQDAARQLKAAGWDGQEFTVTIREEEEETFVDIEWDDEEEE